jgi:hypothetical protein
VCAAIDLNQAAVAPQVDPGQTPNVVFSPSTSLGISSAMLNTSLSPNASAPVN